MRVSEILLVLAVAFHHTSCAKVDAKAAASIAAGAEQAACTLVEVLSSNTFAGVVCGDVAGVVTSAISAIKTDSSAAGGPCQLTPLYEGARYVGETCLAFHDAADQALKARAPKAAGVRAR
jgi:hypothetical protein